jgi:uncharacterized protein (TIGR00661 family)
MPFVIRKFVLIRISLESKKRILVAPLDWGLGHATRCIPVIRQLLEQDAEVIIAADKRPLELLKNEFPTLEFIVLPGYNIHYPQKGSMALQMLWQIPKLLAAIKREHAQLEEIIKQKIIDAVISDNRYGLWSKQIPCIFITHQLFIKAPFGELILHTINKRYINRYTKCWVPDIEGTGNLSGELSHNKKISLNTFFIGPLSRFSSNVTATEKWDILAILSGPEPQRSVFEKIILDELRTTKLKCLVVQGIPEKNDSKKLSGHIEIVSHLNSTEMNKMIIASELIISRPGYSTIMDLSVLGKKAIFIPTPGQTEQQYLAKKLNEEKIALFVQQNKFNLTAALTKVKSYKGFTATQPENNTLKKGIENLLRKSN